MFNSFFFLPYMQIGVYQQRKKHIEDVRIITSASHYFHDSISGFFKVIYLYYFIL